MHHVTKTVVGKRAVQVFQKRVRREWVGGGDGKKGCVGRVGGGMGGKRWRVGGGEGWQW